ncbi:hypothetical protein [Gemella haemolysans]|jgi:putative conjugative transposon protein|uniref:Replication initiator protein A n=2 Tax=Gemella haemolysans TaxID=1379 RepID=A0ABX6KG69_9BACL|nr:hypothetical protein [Gemella haemolysans]EGF86045.1 hypothetical protein HMPREF0428_01847 [Gemella haemolysans M341]QIX87279.1 hypothetical protein FOC48_00185 [Gemella haemolysans]QIX89018.1 hypothetical protein FOC48_09725 [Gemella haemolysans]
MEQKVIKVIPLNLSLLEVLGQGKVYEALVLQQVDYWCTINKNKNEYYIEGSYWMFSSVKKMLERDFPLCFSYDTLKRTLINLEEGNFLITKKHKNGKLYRVNYNKISFDKKLKLDKNITKNENKNQKSRLVQNAPTEKVKLGQNASTQKLEVRANCINGEGKMHQPVRAECTNQLGQNAPTIKEINKENNIYINYNNFIKNKELNNNKGLTDKDNLYNQTNNDLIYSGGLKKDVELAISQVYLKLTGDYKINGVSVDVMRVQDVLKDVTETQINYCVQQILKSKQITNFENYVIASLYNSVTRDKQNKINNQNSTLGKFNWWDE